MNFPHKIEGGSSDSHPNYKLATDYIFYQLFKATAFSAFAPLKIKRSCALGNVPIPKGQQKNIGLFTPMVCGL